MFLRTAQLNRDSTGAVRSIEFDDIYHSEIDPVAEKRYVFRDQHRLAERWRQYSRDHQSKFTILDCGFGLGLNFVLTAELWCKVKPVDLTLHYISVEKHPVSQDDLQSTLQGFKIEYHRIASHRNYISRKFASTF